MVIGDCCSDVAGGSGSGSGSGLAVVKVFIC